MDVKDLNETYEWLQMRCNALLYGLHHRAFETE